MKIKILKTGEIHEAILDSEGNAHLFRNDNDSRYPTMLYDQYFEIVPEPRQPKFKIGDMVSYISGVGGAATVFKINVIMQDFRGFVYSDCKDSNRIDEDVLTLHIEPEKPKTEIRYQYIIKCKGIRPQIMDSLYLDGQDAKSMGVAHVEWIKRIDTPYEVSI
jgi:hypothetical protein